jgi:HPt (histidine-containing phosphotransfer) domain-containing protein
MAQTAEIVDVTQYPGVDWNLCLELTADNEALAKDLLNMFVASLPADFSLLETAYADHDYAALKDQAHKLHGALCYCGIPKMKTAMIGLEKACIAAQNDSGAPSQLVTEAYLPVKKEIENLLNYVSCSNQ